MRDWLAHQQKVKEKGREEIEKKKICNVMLKVKRKS